MKPGAAAVLLAAAACMASCTTPEVHVYKMYGGPERPGADLSVIDLGIAAGVMIGNRKVARSDYSKIQLLPGTYPVYWECLYDANFTTGQNGFATGAQSADVELLGGHVYSLGCQVGYGYTYKWIRDETEGRIVAGQQKP